MEWFEKGVSILLSVSTLVLLFLSCVVTSGKNSFLYKARIKVLDWLNRKKNKE